MTRQNILFGRFGNKTNDIKHFKHLLPLDVKIVVEPFGGTFAVTRIIYNDDKYVNYVNDNDETLYYIYKNSEKYSKMCKELNAIALNNINKNGKVVFVDFMEEIKDKNYDKIMLDYWKIEKIIRGYSIKISKHIDHSNFIKCMKNINFSCKNFKDIINKFRKQENVFIFLDPPYLFSDNSHYSQQQRKEGSDMTHIIYEIFEILQDKTTKAKIMMIMNDMKIIRYIFKDFVKGEYEKIYQIGKRKSIHLIITNY